jgi:hypothetical protein
MTVKTLPEKPVKKYIHFTALIGEQEKEDIDKMIAAIVAKTGNKNYQDYYRRIVKLGTKELEKEA